MIIKIRNDKIRIINLTGLNHRIHITNATILVFFLTSPGILPWFAIQSQRNFDIPSVYLL